MSAAAETLRRVFPDDGEVRDDTRLIDRLADALEAAEAARDATLAVIEEAREWRDPAYEAGWGSPDDYASGYRMALRNVRRILSSVPADALRERDVARWDEGWEASGEGWNGEYLPPGTRAPNPYRIKEEN